MPHTFHIPVMGTGFTIDSPLKVARFGISSVVSLGDDRLIEKVRRHYCALYGEEYAPILDTDDDHRARRITEYLDLVDRAVHRQVRDLQASRFENGGELSKYFEWLDDADELKKTYLRFKAGDGALAPRLREAVRPGAIDVNIMTKADRENSAHGEKLPREYSDAMAALRGFAKSTLRSSVVFSAGLNLHLYSYLSEFDDFYPDAEGRFKKKVTLKVSDFRSAFVQAKMLAKKGVWVSEYRIESGLNCGGHAFPTTGHLMGPILEEFKTKKDGWIDSLFAAYHAALTEKKRLLPSRPPDVRITAQGGVGTAAEHRLLIRHFGVASVGWGSPFLLVPEATTVDEETLEKLALAGEKDIYLSQASPLGVPFYNLRGSASEEARRGRIQAGAPGSPCRHQYLAFNTEFGVPLCTASSAYQQRKLRQLAASDLPPAERIKEREKVLEKSCICRDLGDGVLLKYGIPDGKQPTPAVCPGPNLAYFSKIRTLKEMVDHIYGRADCLDPAIPRSHCFVNELKLYIRHLKELIAEACHRITQKEAEYFDEFRKNLLDGIDYYQGLAQHMKEESEQSRRRFLADLQSLKDELLCLSPVMS